MGYSPSRFPERVWGCRHEPGHIKVDRPDFTESTDTLPPATIQLEGGFAVSHHALAAGSVHRSTRIWVAQ
jgi:hypothetical protein